MLDQLAPSAEMIRAGQAGQVTAQVLAEWPALAGPVDLALVELGTNDVDKTSIDAFGTAYPQVIERVRAVAPDAPLLCLGPWGRPDKTEPFNEVVEQTCQAAGGRFVELSNAYLDETYRGPANSVTDTGVARDTFHPNDRGHALIARRILRAL